MTEPTLVDGTFSIIMRLIASLRPGPGNSTSASFRSVKQVFGAVNKKGRCRL